MDVVDSLVVTLGLDPKEYQKGAAKAKAAQQDLFESVVDNAEKIEATQRDLFNATRDTHYATAKLQKEAVKSDKQVGDTKKKEAQEDQRRRKDSQFQLRQETSEQIKLYDGVLGKIKSFGLWTGAAILGFDTLKGAMSAYGQTTNQLAEVGRFAPTVGATVQEVQTLSNALQQVGGSAQDAQTDLAKLGHAQFSYRMGAPDALAGWAMRTGVSLFDAQGKERDKLDILQDMGKQIRAMTPDRQAQAMYAREMGLSEASIQLYVLQEADKRAQILSDAQATAIATEKMTKDAADLNTQLARTKQTMQGIKQTAVGNTAPGSVAALRVINDSIQKGGPGSVTKAIGAATIGAMNFVAGLFGNPFVDASGNITTSKGGKSTTPVGGAGLGVRNNNPGNLETYKGYTGTSSGIYQTFQTPQAGFDALMAQLRRNLGRGHTTLGDLIASYEGYDAKNNNIPAYVQDVSGRTHMGANQQVRAGDLADIARAMTIHEGNADLLKQIDVSHYSEMTTPNAGAPGGTATTNVDIGTIQINAPQARNAGQIAAEIPNALKRKGVVAQANTGMN